jgi:hypothetical protein
VQLLFSTKWTPTVMAASTAVNSANGVAVLAVVDSEVAVLVTEPVVVVLVTEPAVVLVTEPVHPALNHHLDTAVADMEVAPVVARHRTIHQPAMVAISEVLREHPLVSVVNHSSPRHPQALVVQRRPTQLMLKVSSKIQTHKSSVVQLLVVLKHTHRKSPYDSFNPHLCHHQA